LTPLKAKTRKPFFLNDKNCPDEEQLSPSIMPSAVCCSTMNPRSISINDYTYSLPEEKIARYPLAERDASKLLIYRNGQISEDIYYNIDTYLPADSLLVFNNTKVIEARLQFQKTTGGVIEIFCLEPHEQYADITSGLSQRGKVWWKCLIGGASKWKPGQVLQKVISYGKELTRLEAKYIDKLSDCFIVELSWQPPNLSFAEILHYTGAIPLPPYIKRAAELSDAERYQTTYAIEDGSVAAPTAGLHFTEHIFQQLQHKGIHQCFVTLHVGAGTFKPVKSATLQEHEMHAEFIDVSVETIEQLLAHPQIFAVGTTSLRTLESLYWMGVKTILNPSIQPDSLFIQQWEVYDTLDKHDIPVKESLEGLLQWMNNNNLQRILSKTQICIVPGYVLRMIKGIITNFHQPQSTLLLLVAAIVGKDWKKLYNYALQNNFRFLSYGDGSLLYVH
jgi:S-adenosylmethionine:tRNA ribosyltransferase-isomerase